MARNLNHIKVHVFYDCTYSIVEIYFANLGYFKRYVLERIIQNYSELGENWLYLIKVNLMWNLAQSNLLILMLKNTVILADHRIF